ncbi:MAG: O-antigen translocase [Rubrivivax sp.]
MRAPQAGAGLSYRQILRSSTVMGSASLLNMAIGLVRTKLFALWLGPSGVGLMGVLGTTADLARSVASLGLNQSGVRQIAESAAEQDAARMARTVAALRATAYVLGAAGGLALALASPWVSQLTFGTTDRWPQVAVLGAVIFFRLVADGYGALVHGMRRIADMARADLMAVFFGSVIAVGLVAVLHEDGVAPALLAIAAVSALTSWWASRRAGLPRQAVPRAELGAEVRALLRMGLAMMGGSLLTLGAAWGVRMVLVRHAGLAEAGLYQSAWTLSGLGVGVILQAMGADFYPRLVSVARDHSQINQLVNEQTQVSLLLAGVGVMATMTLAPVAVPLLYSRAFGGTEEVLRWLCLGMTLRVLTWPMGYILVAKGASRCFVATEAVWAAAHVGLAALLVGAFGLTGAGMAFFGAYAVQAVLLATLVRRTSGMRWSRANFRTARVVLPTVVGTFLALQLLPHDAGLVVGLAATLALSAWSLRTLARLVPEGRLARWLVRRGL